MPSFTTCGKGPGGYTRIAAFQDWIKTTTNGKRRLIGKSNKSQIPPAPYPTIHTWTEMCTFMFQFGYCGIWDSCILEFMKWGHFAKVIFLRLILLDFDYNLDEICFFLRVWGFKSTNMWWLSDVSLQAEVKFEAWFPECRSVCIENKN